MAMVPSLRFEFGSEVRREHPTDLLSALMNFVMCSISCAYAASGSAEGLVRGGEPRLLLGRRGVAVLHPVRYLSGNCPARSGDRRDADRQGAARRAPDRCR